MPPRFRFSDPGVSFLRVIAPASGDYRKGTSKTRTVRVLSNATNPQIVTTTLPNGAVGAPYSATVATADGRAGTWSIEPGALPPGLTIAPATGVISGTPTAAGTSQFGVYFRDGDGRVAARAYQVAISVDGPVISTTTLPGATVGVAYTATLQTADDRAGAWAVTTGALPAGLTLAPATGVISGTPTTAGTSTFTVTFTDAANKTATKQLSIEVSGADQLIVTTSLPNGVKGTAYTATLQSKDNRAGTWSITGGALPAGLTLAPATGVISGTPTAAGKADFTVRFQDANSNTSTRALSITIVEPGVWDLASGTLPAGLTLAPTTGVISGTPTATGTSAFVIRFRDTLNISDTQALSIVVTNPPPVIATTTLPKGKVDTAYTATLTTEDSRPGTWSISAGTLPTGLTLAPATGVISGTPTEKATSNFTVKFKDAEGLEVTKALSIQIQSCFLIFCS